MSRKMLSILGVGFVVLIFGLVVPAEAQKIIGGAPAQPKALSGSYVVFDPSVGGDVCYTPGAPGTFCFRDESFTNDYEYRYNVWHKFPADWNVTNVYVQGTPVCDSGASWGTFGWSFETVPYEVNIGHTAYQASTDHCVAYYCFDATAGAGPADAGVSWYWDGDEYANPPHNPCSADQYTPASMSGEPCDEWINPVATVPSCGAQGAAILLTKTVGTVPAVCAVTDEITVATGTDVYYCYVVENTGDVTLNFHDLVDDHLGTLLDAFPYTLDPGASAFLLVPDTVTGPVVNTATWTAADVIGGYALDDTIAYNFEDISATGTPFALTDDSVAQFPIGFSFDFYGTPYTDFWVSSNGFLSAADEGNGCCSGQALPDPTQPNGLIAGWWEDLYPPGGGSVVYQTLGSAPNRYTIVQFTDIQHFSSGNPVTMQFKLFEGSNVIEVHYQAAPSDAGTHTAGLENQDGTVGLVFYYGPDALTTPEAVRYTPQEVSEASATDTATVNISDPDINVTPASMVSSLMVGTTESQVLTIGNTGTGVLDWTIEEAGAPTAVVGPFPPILEVAGPGNASVADERVGDVPVGKTPTWYPERGPWAPPEAVIYDNGPIVTHPGGGAGGADASALQTAIGMDTYGFGAQLSAGNRVADDFTVTYAGGWQIDTITFFAYQTGSGTTSSISSLNLQIWDGPPNAGGSVIWGNTTTNIMTSTTWSNIYRVLDTALTNTDRPVMAVVGTVGTVLPPGTYWLDWQFDGSPSFSGPWQPPVTILGQTTTGNALQYTGAWAPLVDGGTLTPQGLPFIIDGAASQCMMPEDVPWLSVSPNAGTTPGGGSTPVDVTFDATAVGVGTYNALLCVLSNDPDEPLVEVPVEMNVVIPVELMGISVE